MSLILTEREMQVLSLMADGRTRAEIARTLGLSPKLVSHNTTSIFKKLGVHSANGAVSYAVKHGLVGVREVTK